MGIYLMGYIILFTILLTAIKTKDKQVTVNGFMYALFLSLFSWFGVTIALIALYFRSDIGNTKLF